MHITLYSACEKKAWKRSRKILDSYANRVGERAWQTPITMEGLSELHKLLRSAASRQTAIACYRNDGVSSMKLLWTVGRKDLFSKDGFYPVAYKRNPRKEVPPSLRLVSLLSRGSGYLHDWGKSSEDFARKLEFAIGDSMKSREDAPVEYARHEWLSYVLFRGALENGFEDAHKAAESINSIKDCKSIKKGFSTARGAMEYIILTHHKLLGAKDKMNINGDSHIKEGTGQVGSVAFRGSIDPAIYKNAIHCLERLDDTDSSEYWRLPATIARAAMIMADHYISSIDYKMIHGQCKTDTLFANTKKEVDILKRNDRDARGIVRMDQPLNWHLRNVAEKADDIAYHILTESYPGLSEITVESIMEESSIDRFKWQDEGVRFIKSKRPLDSEAEPRPCLVFSAAGTGAGKTRANAKFACSLSDTPRFCVALNLRSLTLQTGDSMRNDLNIMDHEMAVVIGDKVSERLHRASSDAFSTFDENEREIEVDVMGEEFEPPAWLSPLAKNGKQTSLIVPPVLVSTIDFIVNAGEPGRQGHHALALLRVMNSDLVLDEIDSYDPVAMIAVLRLVQTAAMMGRSVICSSATLSVPVATAVYKAFQSGLKMRVAEQQYRHPQVFLIDDQLDPECYQEAGHADSFETLLRDRHSRIIESLKKKPVYRKPMIIRPELDCETSEDARERAYFSSIAKTAREFHQRFAWEIDPGQGFALSFGLIRVANIKTAIKLGYYLSEALRGIGARIACYHANEMKIQRHMKEKKLDLLLNRKTSKVDHILSDPDMMASFDDMHKCIPFIVIATPVEEVGRDHDFDWAIIEPSSAQSIVQTAGRVNRHRLVEIDSPNIAILDYNVRSLTTKKGSPVFEKPGFESSGHLYSSRSISDMLDVDDERADLDRIDASFRLGKRKIARDEDRIISRSMEEGVDVVLDGEDSRGLWMSNWFYATYPLRGFISKERFRLFRDEGSTLYTWQQLTNTRAGEEVWEERPFVRVPEVRGGWLHWSDADLAEECEKLGIAPEEGMAVEIARYRDGVMEIEYHESFGFVIQGSIPTTYLNR